MIYIFLFFFTLTIKPFFEEIINYDYQTKCNKTICQKEHAIIKKIMHKMHTIWFVADLLQSVQEAVNLDASPYYQILAECICVFDSIKQLTPNTWNDHEEDKKNFINIAQILLQHQTLEINKPILKILETIIIAIKN